MRPLSVAPVILRFNLILSGVHSAGSPRAQIRRSETKPQRDCSGTKLRVNRLPRFHKSGATIAPPTVLGPDVSRTVDTVGACYSDVRLDGVSIRCFMSSAA